MNNTLLKGTISNQFLSSFSQTNMKSMNVGQKGFCAKCTLDSRSFCHHHEARVI